MAYVVVVNGPAHQEALVVNNDGGRGVQVLHVVRPIEVSDQRSVRRIAEVWQRRDLIVLATY